MNAWDTRTNGVDLVGRKQFEFDGGTLDLTAAASFLDTEVEQRERQVNVGGTAITVIGNSRIRDAETGVPKNKYILNGRYSLRPLGPWTRPLRITAATRYNVGNVPGVATANGNIDQEFSPETYVDLGVDYELLQRRCA